MFLVSSLFGWSLFGSLLVLFGLLDELLLVDCCGCLEYYCWLLGWFGGVGLGLMLYGLAGCLVCLVPKYLLGSTLYLRHVRRTALVALGSVK